MISKKKLLHLPVVDDGDYRANDANYRPLSASQITRFSDCERRWGWEYIAKIRSQPSAAAAFGTSVHAQLERWLRDGIPPDFQTPAGKVASAGIDFLPLPGPSLDVERKFAVQIGNHIYIGYVDLGFDAAALAEKRFEGVWVVDHKTTSDFCWQKTEEDLQHDVQALLYAKEALDRYQVDEVTLMWLYYRTRNQPKAQPTILKITRKYVDQVFGAIEELADQIVHARKTITDPMQLPINPMHCEAFGGCPHIQRCGLTGPQRMKAIMAQKEKRMNALERIKARRQAGANNGQTAPAKPVVVETTAREQAPDPKPATVTTTPRINPPEEPEQVAGEPQAEAPATTGKRRGRKPKSATENPVETGASSTTASNGAVIVSWTALEPAEGGPHAWAIEIRGGLLMVTEAGASPVFLPGLRLSDF